MTVSWAPGVSSTSRRVLLDESVPHDLLLHLPGMDVTTVQAQGWSGMKNGVLLRTAQGSGYHVLVTVDRRLEYQQNIPKSGIALVVLHGRSTRMSDLLPLIPTLILQIPDAKEGEVTHVTDSER